MKRLPGLDLLRAVAIVWVMLYHLTSWGPVLPEFIEYGYIGVDLFFVLSGFLIGWQLLKPYTLGLEPQWRQFFLRRAFRVLPAYWVVLAVYFAVPAVRESPDIQALWHFLTFTQNMFPDYFRARAFSHAWSLCIEEHFYLLLPAVVWLLARKPTMGSVATVAIATLLGGMLLRGWIWQHDVEPFLQIRSGEGNFFERYVKNVYNPTYNRLDGLLAGVMLAVIKGFRPAWWSWAMARGTWFLTAGLMGVCAALSLESPGCLSAVIGFPMLSISLAAIVLASVSPRTWLGRWRIPGVAPIAAMAFSLYLTHKAVYSTIQTQLGEYLPDSNLLALGVYLGASLTVGTVLYLTVERPGMRLRERFMKSNEGRRAPELHRCDRHTFNLATLNFFKGIVGASVGRKESR
ncbi:acyltransferase [Oxalobacteraceae bacterium]|nr:acyltransferase [Oxalobacteraceae bacterium]